jgi:hypothetical protein
MGMDCNDLSVLGAEVETTLGKEMEKHSFNTPTVVVVPQGFPHGRTTILKLDKPIIFAVIRPLSAGGTKDRATYRPAAVLLDAGIGGDVSHGADRG